MRLDESPICDLPALPEDVEALIGQIQADGDAGSASLQRKTKARFSRVDAWSRERDGDLHDWIVEKTRAHVVEYGQTEFRIESPAHDAVVWTARIPDVQEEIVMKSADPLALLNASWALTFRAADMMLKATSVAPRLMSEVGEVHTASMDMLREAHSTSSVADVAEIKADAGGKKLDRILGVLSELNSGGGGGNAKGNSTGVSSEESSETAWELIDSLEEEDRARVLAHPLGRALAQVRDAVALKKGVADLWAAHRDGELKLAKGSLASAQEVIDRFTSKR